MDAACIKVSSLNHQLFRKTTLQEVVQRHSGQVLTYHMVSQSGPDHNKTFLFEVRLNDRPIGQGEGRSKKEAEQAAAKDALSSMN